MVGTHTHTAFDCHAQIYNETGIVPKIAVARLKQAVYIFLLKKQQQPYTQTCTLQGCTQVSYVTLIPPQVAKYIAAVIT